MTRKVAVRDVAVVLAASDDVNEMVVDAPDASSPTMQRTAAPLPDEHPAPAPKVTPVGSEASIEAPETLLGPPFRTRSE